MSYDVWLTVDTGAAEPVEIGSGWNYTYNCAPMFQRALGGNGIRDLDGMTGAEAAPKLTNALATMADKGLEVEFLAMNPPNGWGSFAGARKFIAEILAGCSEHPLARLRVS